MGLGLIMSSCRCDCPPPQKVEVEVSVAKAKEEKPAHKDYHILDMYESYPYTALLVQYTHATNFEGRKVLIYKAHLSTVLVHAKEHGLDPHFCEGPHPSPVARFEPDRWYDAKKVVDFLVRLDRESQTFPER